MEPLFRSIVNSSKASPNKKERNIESGETRRKKEERERERERVNKAQRRVGVEPLVKESFGQLYWPLFDSIISY